MARALSTIGTIALLVLPFTAAADPFDGGLTALQVSGVVKCQDTLNRESQLLVRSLAQADEVCGQARLQLTLKAVNGVLTPSQAASQQTSVDNSCAAQAVKFSEATTRFIDYTAAACAPVEGVLLDSAKDPLELVAFYGELPLNEILGLMCGALLVLTDDQIVVQFPSIGNFETPFVTAEIDPRCLPCSCD